MQHRSKLSGLRTSATISVADAKVSALRRDYDHAKAEITKLKLALAQARNQLHELEEVTSEFVHLVI